MQSDFRSSRSDGIKALSEGEELPPAEEYGLHLDYRTSVTSAKKSAEYDTPESISIYGMIFRVDPLTRELVLQEHLTVASPTNSSLENESRPGDILCKLDEIDVHYWSPSSVSSFLSELQISRKLRRLGLYRKGSGLILVEIQASKSSELYQPTRSTTQDLPLGEAEPSRRAVLSSHSSHNISDSADNESYAAHADSQSSRDVKSYYSFDPDGRDDNRHSSMQATVLKRYKSKIESLTKSLESAHFYMNRQEERIAELEQQLLRESAVTGLKYAGQEETNRVDAVQEAWKIERATMAKEFELVKAQLASKDIELRQAQALFETLKQDTRRPQETNSASEVENLRQEISELKSELDFLKNNGGASSLPADNAKIFADLQYDLEATYASKNELEAQISALKRNCLIQTVEIKELQDHINGLEKQNKVGEVLRFPPLPGLESIWESLREEAWNENDASKRLLAADEENQRAQQELFLLRKNEHRVQQLELVRQQSELMLEAAQREIKALKGAPSSMNATKQLSGSEHARLQTAEQSLLKANLIVSGQAKQLDDLRLENEELQLQQQKLDEELKRLKSVPAYVHEISPDSHSTQTKCGDEQIDLSMLQNRLVESELNEKSALQELEVVQNALATCRGQNSAAELEIRVLNSQLEAITDASRANEQGLMKRIKDLEMIAIENQGSELKMSTEFNVGLNGASASPLSSGFHKNRPETSKPAPLDVTTLLENQNKIIVKLQEECKSLQLDLADTKARQIQAESRLQASLRTINELSEGVTSFSSTAQGEDQKSIQTNLVKSFDSLTEEFELLKECVSHTKDEDICVSKLNSSQNKLELMTEQIRTLSEKLANRDAELNLCKMQLDRLAGQLQGQIEMTERAADLYKTANSELVLLMKGTSVEKLPSSQPDCDPLIVKINSIKALVTNLQSDITEKQAQINRLSTQKDEALVRLREQGSELATIKVVTTELESEIAHIRFDRDRAHSELKKQELYLHGILSELEAKQEQVNVLTTIVEAIRTTSPITWSDIPGHQSQQDYPTDREGTLTLGAVTKAEAAYHF